MAHPSGKYSSEDNLKCKTFSSRVNETEEPFNNSLDYPSNPLNPFPHPPNPHFKDSR